MDYLHEIYFNLEKFCREKKPAEGFAAEYAAKVEEINLLYKEAKFLLENNTQEEVKEKLDSILSRVKAINNWSQ